ncbi:MAG: hypothetical protein KA270_17410 [Saprospiraceae bacterium]|nr:hypothetical protein [Saprospiraceae bacterium]MBP6568957.1 hypothetical protein [Saprospiraceae bacterium]
MIDKNNELLIGRLYNYKFRSATAYTKGENEYVITVIQLLNNLFGNMGGGPEEENSFAILTDRILSYILPKHSFYEGEINEWNYIREENDNLIQCIVNDDYENAVNYLDGESEDIKKTVMALANTFGSNSGLGLLSEFTSLVDETLIKDHIDRGIRIK